MNLCNLQLIAIYGNTERYRRCIRCACERNFASGGRRGIHHPPAAYTMHGTHISFLLPSHANAGAATLRRNWNEGGNGGTAVDANPSKISEVLGAAS